MCDYSITAKNTRDAEVGDKLIVTAFVSSRGFARMGDGKETATCLLPGTELAFEGKTVAVGNSVVEYPFNTAIFRQKEKHQLLTHHDMIEFPDGQTALLAFLKEGQKATVLQLPAKPKTDAERQEQRRAEYAG